jgi:hypothetical protein
MVKTIVKDVNGVNIPFMFSVRSLQQTCDVLKVNGLQEMISANFIDPSPKAMAAIIYAGYENACFYQKTTPIYTSIDDTYTLMDELGLEESAELVRAAFEAYTLTGDTKKKK